MEEEGRCPSRRTQQRLRREKDTSNNLQLLRLAERMRSCGVEVRIEKPGWGLTLKGQVPHFGGLVFLFRICTFYRLLEKQRVGSFLSKQTGFNCCYCQCSCKYHIKRAF